MKNDFSNDEATAKWLDSFKAKRNTRNTYATSWRRFSEYLEKAFGGKMTGDQILADRKLDGEAKWEKIVLNFKQWMATEAR